MSKSFDKILVRRIREVFDNHQEPVDPDAWKDMERRLNQGRSLRLVYVSRIAGVAALFFLLILVFRPFESQRDVASSMEQVVQSESETSAGAPSTRQPAVEDNPQEETVADRSVPEKTAASKKDQSGGIEDRQAYDPISKRSLLTSGISVSSSSRSDLNRATRSKPPETLTVQFDQSAESRIWEDLPNQPASPEKSKAMKLEMEFSTLYNYSSSMIASEVNFAGGIISEFQLLPDLKLSTGLVVSRQYFTTRKRGGELTSYLIANSSYSRTDEQNQLDGNLADGVYQHFRDVSNKVKLVGLDVPVNIEYRIDNVSLSAGISSFTYLQEKYRHNFTSNYLVYEYDQQNNIVGTDNVVRKETVSETYNPLGKMDLASVLNVAVGYHFEAGSTRLVIEPFMKHPLGDLASRDLRFGARGVRIRIGF